ncbi:50S ribosomal protein L1 [bacterium]|nr:50S ribosomal protein L1 [bacterium]
MSGRKYLEKQQAFGDRNVPKAPLEGLELLKKHARDWESVDVDIRLGINTRKADQNIRGTTILPSGTGKTPRVVVLCKADKAEEATAAGADHVGLEELIEKISGGWVEFDIVIATPDVMKDVSKVAKVLGPRGMMPNPKSGTVTNDLTQAVGESKSGKVEYRADKTGIVHLSFGRASFSLDELQQNLDHLMTVILKARPSTVKGNYVKSVFISSTQSPAVKLDHNSFSA